MLSIQKIFDSSAPKILQPGRIFLKEGVLKKVPGSEQFPGCLWLELALLLLLLLIIFIYYSVILGSRADSLRSHVSLHIM